MESRDEQFNSERLDAVGRKQPKASSARWASSSNLTPTIGYVAWPEVVSEYIEVDQEALVGGGDIGRA